jgi:putative flippase GtrA
MSAAPQPKVVAGGAAGAVSIVIVWLLGAQGTDVPPEVASAFTVILGTLAAYLKR